MADLVIVTRGGLVKRTDVKEYKTHHRATGGVLAVRLRKGDEVAGMVEIERAAQTVMVVTNKGTALRFKAGEIPRTGRRTQGVIALKVKKGEQIVLVTAL